MMKSLKLLIFHTLISVMLYQDNTIEIHKFRICASKTAV